MDFVARVLSGSGRLKDRAKDVDELNRVFRANQDSVKKIVEKDGSELHALLDMIYDSSFPEEKVFMKNPSRELLKFKKELVLRLLSGMDSQGVPVTGMMLSLVRKHGIETISDTLISFLKLLTPVLESKEAPDFTTDDVLDAIDMEWHTSSNTASPLLNVFASMTNSPRRSAASASESPLSNPLPNYRRAFSDRATLDGPSRHESLAKSTFDKAAPRLSKSISAQHADRKDLALSETSQTIPYNLNLDSSEEFGPRNHRRKSSSLRDLLAEDTDLKDTEAAVGMSKRRSTPRASLDFNVTSSPSAFTSVSPRRSQQFSRDGSQQLPHDRDNDKTGKNNPFLESSRSIVWGQDDGAFTVDFLDDSFEIQKGSPSLSTGGELPENIGFKSDRNLDTDAVTTPLVSVRDERSESDIGGSKSDRNLDTAAIATNPAEEADECSSIQARTEDNRMPETASSTIFPAQSSTSDSISQSESVPENTASSEAETSREIIEFSQGSEEFPVSTSEPNNVSTEQYFLPSTSGAESPPQETAESGDLPTSTEINSSDNTTCQEDQAEDLILPATVVLPSGAELDLAAPSSMVDSSEQGINNVPSHTPSTNCENAMEIGGQMSLNHDYQKPSISIGEPAADDVMLHMDYPGKVANPSDNGPCTDQSFMEKFQSAESAGFDGKSTNLNARAFFEKEGGSAELKDVEEVTGFQEFGLVTTTQNPAYEFEDSKAAETPVCEVETDSASKSAGGSSITDALNAPTSRRGSDVEDGSHDNIFNAIKEDTYPEVLQEGVPLGDMHRNNREELKDTTDETLDIFPEVAKSQKFEPLRHTDNDAVKLLVASILGDILGEFPEVDHVSRGEKIQLHRLEPQVLMGDVSSQVTEFVNDGSIDAPSDEPVPTVSFACLRETEDLPNLLDSDVKLSLPKSEKSMNLVMDNAESSHDPSITNNKRNNQETVLVMDNEELSHDPSITNNTDDNCVICSPSVEDSSSGECPPLVVDVSQEDAVNSECVGDVLSERNSDTDAQAVDIEAAVILDNEDLEGEHAAHVDGDHGSDNNGGANALLENATWEAEEENPSTKEDALAKLVKDEIATVEEDAFTLEERNAEAIDDVGIDNVQDSDALTDEGLKDDGSIQSSETIGDVGIDNYVQDSEALIEEDPKDDVSIETSESLLKTDQLEGGPKDDGYIESSENLLLTNVEEGRKDDVSIESSEDSVNTECAGQLQPSVSDVQMVGLPVMDIPAARSVDDLVLKAGEEEANGLSGRKDEPSLEDIKRKSEPSLEDTHKSEVDRVVWPDARTGEGEVVKGNFVAALEELLKQERNGTRSERGSWLENAAQENPCTTETMNMDASLTRADQEHEFLKPSLLDTNSKQGSLPSENVKKMDSSTPQSVNCMPSTVATKEDESDATIMEFSNAVSGPSVEPNLDLDSSLWAEDPPDEIPKPQTNRFLGKLRQRFCCGKPSTH